MSDERTEQDFYDRMMGGMTGRGDVIKTAPAIRRTVTFLGPTETFNVQTFRSEQTDQKPDKKTGRYPMGDTIFIEHSSAKGFNRYVVPPQVAALIFQQRMALDSKTRKRAAAKAVETKKARKTGGSS